MDSSAILKYFVNFILPRIINECDINSQNSVIVQWIFFFPKFNITFLRAGWEVLAGQHEGQGRMTSGAFVTFLPQ